MICQHIKSGSHCKVCEVAPEKKKRKRINQTSVKYQLELKVYSSNRVDFLRENPVCAVCGGVSSQVHHAVGRGVNLNNVASWLPVCAECHERIENNPEWAKAEGYSGSRLI